MNIAAKKGWRKRPDTEARNPFIKNAPSKMTAANASMIPNTIPNFSLTADKIETLSRVIERKPTVSNLFSKGRTAI